MEHKTTLLKSEVYNAAGNKFYLFGALVFIISVAIVFSIMYGFEYIALLPVTCFLPLRYLYLLRKCHKYFEENDTVKND